MKTPFVSFRSNGNVSICMQATLNGMATWRSTGSCYYIQYMTVCGFGNCDSCERNNNPNLCLLILPLSLSFFGMDLFSALSPVIPIKEVDATQKLDFKCSPFRLKQLNLRPLRKKVSTIFSRRNKTLVVNDWRWFFGSSVHWSVRWLWELEDGTFFRPPKLAPKTRSRDSWCRCAQIEHDNAWRWRRGRIEDLSNVQFACRVWFSLEHQFLVQSVRQIFITIITHNHHLHHFSWCSANWNELVLLASFFLMLVALWPEVDWKIVS